MRAQKKQPSEADLHEVEEFEKTLAEESAAVELPAAVEQDDSFLSAIDGLPEPRPDDEEPTLAAESAAEKTEAEQSTHGCWLVEDGPRHGARLTNKQMVRLLMVGNLKVGQHIRHERLGQCEVVKGKPPAQKLKQLYRVGSPRFILPAEIATNRFR